MAEIDRFMTPEGRAQCASDEFYSGQLGDSDLQILKRSANDPDKKPKGPKHCD